MSFIEIYTLCMATGSVVCAETSHYIRKERKFLRRLHRAFSVGTLMGVMVLLLSVIVN